MATIRDEVCDRCGNKLWVEGERGKLLVSTKKIPTLIKITGYFCGNYDGYHYTDTHYDLCECCRKELVSWVKNK